MSNASNPHSITPSKPVDPSTIRVLRAVDNVASSLNCPFFVAGATARDLMLVNVYGLRPGVPPAISTSGLRSKAGMNSKG